MNLSNENFQVAFWAKKSAHGANEYVDDPRYITWKYYGTTWIGSGFGKF